MLVARHGEADWNAEGRWQGQADRPLTVRGREQAGVLAERIRGASIAAAYTSDLGRAYDTAILALEGRQISITPLPGLRERSFGSWDGLLDEEISRRYPAQYATWLRGESAGAVDAETYEALSDRVTWTIETLVVEHHQETVLVVTHSGPIAVVQAMALNLDFTDATQRRSLPELGNCELLSVATDGRFRLLDNDGRT